MHFLNLPYNILWGIGIFSSSSSSKWALWQWVFYVYRAIIFIILIMAIVLMTIQLFVAPDLSLLARTIDFWTLFLSGLYKWFYMAKFNDEFAQLNKDLIKIQVQGEIIYGKTANQFTKNYSKQTQPITLMYLFSGIVTATFVIINPLIAFPKSGRSEFDYFNDSKSYPFSYWIPFMIKDYWMFSSVFLCHSITAIYIVLIYLGIDSYMFGAIYAIGGQIELLNSSINTIGNSVDAGEYDKNYDIENKRPIRMDRLTYFTKKQQEICFSMLRECSKHHILIHNYIKKINTEFSSLIIVDYLHGITSLTFALFQLSNSASSVSELITIIVFIFVSGFHQFLNNYFGEFIVQKQQSVGFAAYDIPLWRVNKKSRYLLMLMILRSNKPTLITGFYMYKLCNNSFIMFVKALYSYYMVLRRFNDED